MRSVRFAPLLVLVGMFNSDSLAAEPLLHAASVESARTMGSELPGWVLLSGATAPPRRDHHAMAYDSARQRVVLFGGADENATPLNDTWEWDGEQWTHRLPLVRPPARCWHAMAYDEARGQVVLYGGAASCFNAPANYFGDTWAWNGAEWTELHPNTAPNPARAQHAVAYDPVRGEIVLFGGSNGNPLSDTWTWNGNNWTNRMPMNSPNSWSGSLMAYDAPRDRILLIQGYEMWEWNGATGSWTQRFPSFSNYVYCALAGTPSGALLYGGVDTHETYEWDGLDWRLRPSARHPSAPRTVMVYDSSRDVAVAFGGNLYASPATWRNGETWEWSGIDWTDRTIRNAPSGVTDVRNSPAGIVEIRRASMVYANDLHRVLFFGGEVQDPNAYPTNLWAWDGHAWQVLPCATSPGVTSPVLAYDEDRGRAVLFGGMLNWASPSDRTWEWNGVDWTERFPQGHPTRRGHHAMAYDRARHRTVLFGGADNQTVRGDTWTWDGNTWTQHSSGALTARLLHALAYDARRQRVVLFGGCSDY